MDLEKKNKYPWETLEAYTLFMPIEIIVYHLYRYEHHKNKASKDATQDYNVAKSYLTKEKMKELGVAKCFQKR